MSTDQTWSGERGRYWAENAEWFTHMLGEFGEAVLDRAALRPGERVLDVGCGNGDLTVAAAQAVAPDGSVLGVDLSTDELDVATVRASRRDLTNVELRQADAGADDLGPTPFDVLISRFGVMFFDDPVAAFTHLHGALADGGRLAFACWQCVEANEWHLVPRDAVASVVPVAAPPQDAPGPFAFADADHVRGVLSRAGFDDIGFDDVQRPVHLGASTDETVDFLRNMEWAKTALAGAPAKQVDRALDRVREAVAARALPDGRIELPGAAWVVHARA